VALPWAGMDAEPREEIYFHGHPSWLSLIGVYVRALVISLVVGVAAGIATAIAVGHVETGWVIVAVVVPFFVLAGLAQIRRMQIRYSITSQRLTIETGLMSRDLHQTRLERIQNVNARQSMVQRALGIGTVNFDTAGEAQFDFSFRGVADPRGIVRTVDRALHELRASPGARTADV
jgi:uncharacterized membrane protein YdbT with pleckstrin-like domain